MLGFRRWFASLKDGVCIEGPASLSLQKEIDAQNGGEKGACSFIRRIRVDLLARRMPRKCFRGNVHVRITGIVGGRIAISGILASDRQYIALRVIDVIFGIRHLGGLLAH